MSRQNFIWAFEIMGFIESEEVCLATSMLFSRLALLISRARKALVLIRLMDDARRWCGKMSLGFRMKYGIWRFRAFRL